MKLKVNAGWLVVSLVFFILGIGTLFGKTQEFIKFQSSLNEVAFCVLGLVGSIFTAGASFEIKENN